MPKGLSICDAADFAFCGLGTRRGAAAVVGLAVDLVAAAAFMPMRGAVRRPLFGPVMAESGTIVRSRVGNIAAIALRGLRSVLGTRCIIVGNIACKAMAKGLAIGNAANFAFCNLGARCGAAAVVSLAVDLVAAAAFMPMRGAVRRPLFGPVMAESGTIVRSRVGNIAAIALCSLRSILGTRCVIVRDVARKAVPKGFKRFRGDRDILFAAEQDLSGVSSQPFLFTFSGCRDFTRDRATRSSYGLYVTAAVRTSKFCRCGRISFPRPFGLAVTVAERVTKLKDLFPRFAADRAALVVGCLCCTRCRRDEILFLCILHIDLLCKFTVLNAADFALCKFDTRCGASAVVGLVVDLVAAAAFVPM